MLSAITLPSEEIILPLIAGIRILLMLCVLIDLEYSLLLTICISASRITRIEINTSIIPVKINILNLLFPVSLSMIIMIFLNEISCLILYTKLVRLYHQIISQSMDGVYEI